MLKNTLNLLLLIMLTCTSNYAVAANNKFYPNKLNSCKLTKRVLNDYEPENFITSNNLLVTPGKQELYCGEKIIVHGRVLDKNCRPVSDAKIYLWQVNCSGK